MSPFDPDQLESEAKRYDSYVQETGMYKILTLSDPVGISWVHRHDVESVKMTVLRMKDDGTPLYFPSVWMRDKTRYHATPEAPILVLLGAIEKSGGNEVGFGAFVSAR